jgi:hypothetical protein
MSFSEHWLALRQHADSSARADGLAQAAADWLQRHGTPDRTLYMDLGSGSGANWLHLAPLLSAHRQWLLVDNDAALLANAQTRCAAGTSVRTQRSDLASQLSTLPWDQVALVSASALLDLVSQSWLEQLAALAAAANVPLLCALSYDGRLVLQKADIDDEWLRAAVNAHQQGNKGFGPALGPDATQVAAELLRDQHYWVGTHDSDWQLDAADARDAALLRPLIEGWAEAAAEQFPAEAQRASHWAARRLACVARGELQVTVGHKDLLALPAPR